MKYDDITSSKRRSVKLSIDTGIVAAAKEIGVNLSRVTEDALRLAIKSERERRWRDENKAWIETHNTWIDKHGIPLSDLETL